MAMVAAFLWGGCNGDGGNSPAEGCGDGVLNAAAGEQCDDGNAVDGDGCDASCALEPSANEWLEVDPLRAREYAAMAYDEARSQIVMFGGWDQQFDHGDTWTWDGVDWTQASPAAAPSARAGHAMVYDRVRGQVVLFGGEDSQNLLGDTWTWNGTTWTKLSPATSPQARAGQAMVFDAERGEVVLFGGANASGQFNDTWTWNGTTWTQRAPSESPPARAYHGAAYDAERREVVLFGGWGGGDTEYGDTWTWNGTTWTLEDIASAPASRDTHQLVYDAARGEVVMFGGTPGAPLAEDTWIWNGTTWTEAESATRPSARRGYAAAYDANSERVVLFAGIEKRNGVGYLLADTWAWDGESWTQAYTPPASPPGPSVHAMAYDGARGNTVLFGGYSRAASPIPVDETWILDGTTWQKAQPSEKPTARAFHAMAYDAERGEVVLFGGESAGGSSLADTWTWNGVTWTKKNVAGPPARGAHVMAYDAARKNVVLFGGWNGSTYLGDTWTWDGNAWTQVTTVAPSGRTHAALAYDASRDQMVLFGGISSIGDGGIKADTWIWDGAGWASAASPAAPPARAAHAMSYDGRGRIIMFSGAASAHQSSTAVHSDTWIWDGTTWTEASPANSPSGRQYSTMVYDTAQGHIVLFGGDASNYRKTDTWFWR